MYTRVSIRKKLTRIIMVTSVVTLILACSIFVVYEVIAFRKTLVSHIKTLADIASANSTAALAFRNVSDANETLNSLRTEMNVVAAAIYDDEGRIFTKLSIEPNSQFPAVP